MQISEPAEYSMLGLLKERPMHGYEMYQQFESGTLGEIVHLEMSQLYAFLKKLERLGYIEAQLESQGARPPRKIFQLTAAGQELFLKWLPVPVEKPRDVRMLFLIKLYFAQRFLSAQVPALIERQLHACRHFLARLEVRHDTANFSFEQVVLSSRIHQTRALIAWLEELHQGEGLHAHT